MILMVRQDIWENVDVYVTASNSRMLSSNILTQFRDRGDEIRVYPLSFAESYREFKGDKRFYIQSALSIADQEKKKQEIASLKRIPDSFSKIVVVRDYLKPMV